MKNVVVSPFHHARIRCLSLVSTSWPSVGCSKSGQSRPPLGATAPRSTMLGGHVPYGLILLHAAHHLNSERIKLCK